MTQEGETQKEQPHAPAKSQLYPGTATLEVLSFNYGGVMWPPPRGDGDVDDRDGTTVGLQLVFHKQKRFVFAAMQESCTTEQRIDPFGVKAWEYNRVWPPGGTAAPSLFDSLLFWETPSSLS